MYCYYRAVPLAFLREAAPKMIYHIPWEPYLW